MHIAPRTERLAFLRIRTQMLALRPVTRKIGAALPNASHILRTNPPAPMAWAQTGACACLRFDRLWTFRNQSADPAIPIAASIPLAGSGIEMLALSA
jgi:hypothetical protein